MASHVLMSGRAAATADATATATTNVIITNIL
jgi:hypothetical protein